MDPRWHRVVLLLFLAVLTAMSADSAVAPRRGPQLAAESDDKLARKRAHANHRRSLKQTNAHRRSHSNVGLRHVEELPAPSYTHASRIFDYLWLGDRTAARDTQWLRDTGITHLITVATHDEFAHPNDTAPNQQPAQTESAADEVVSEVSVEMNAVQDLMETQTSAEEPRSSQELDLPGGGTVASLDHGPDIFRVPILDDGLHHIRPHARQVFDLIESISRSSDCKVLVHCVEGKSRSPTFVIAYLMVEKQWTLSQAFDFVKQRRPQIQPRFQFFDQLLQLERELYEDRPNTMRHEDNYVPIILPF